MTNLPEEAEALTLHAQELVWTGEFELCAKVCEQAATVLRELGDRPGECNVLILKAYALQSLGLNDEALEALAICQKLAGELNDGVFLARVFGQIAQVHSGLKDFRQATDFAERSLVAVGDLDDKTRGASLNNLADSAIGLAALLRQEGDDEAADAVLAEGIEQAHQALELARAGGFVFIEVAVLDNLAMLLALTGEYARSLDVLSTVQAMAVEHDFHSMELAARQHTGSIRLMQGDAAEAVPLLTGALAMAAELGELPVQLDILVDLSAALEQVGDLAAALNRYKEFVALDRQLRSGVSATRARWLVVRADLDTARLDAAQARTQSESYLARSQELESEKRVLEQRAQELDRRANVDALTGLSNRHQLERELPRIFDEATVTGRPLAVVILDIDHFKSVNDSFGHAVGDSVLVQVARLLAQNGRVGDLLARLGGEEFLIAFPDLDEAAAIEVCDRLRRNIEGHDWETLRTGLRVTVSLGVCVRTRELDVQEVVEKADLAMYRAKRAGRNRVQLHVQVAPEMPDQDET